MWKAAGIVVNVAIVAYLIRLQRQRLKRARANPRAAGAAQR
jgi:hypothetical protein